MKEENFKCDKCGCRKKITYYDNGNMAQRVTECNSECKHRWKEGLVIERVKE